MGDERVDIEAIARREGAVAHRLALVIDPVEDHVVQRPVHELNERSVHVVDRAEQRLSLAGPVFHSSFLLPPPPPCRATSSPPTLVSPRQRLKTEKSERRDGVNRTTHNFFEWQIDFPRFEERKRFFFFKYLLFDSSAWIEAREEDWHSRETFSSQFRSF